MMPAPSARRKHEIASLCIEVVPTDSTEFDIQQPRLAKAWLLARLDGMKMNGSPSSNYVITFTVPASDGEGRYIVTRDARPSNGTAPSLSCQCDDFTNRKVLCKHIYAVLLRFRLDLLVQPGGSGSRPHHAAPSQPRPQGRRVMPEPEPELTQDQKSKEIDQLVSEFKAGLLNGADNLDSKRLKNLKHLVSFGVKDATQTVNPFEPKESARGKRVQLAPNFKNKKQKK